MSIEDYRKARALIENNGGGCFSGEKPETLIAQAEAALGLQFPPSYRLFLLELGCGGFNGLEIFGVVDNNFKNSSAPDGVWLTLSDRIAINLNPSYVIIESVGDGTYCAIDTSQPDPSGECPVVGLTIEGVKFEKIADSFGSYFLQAVSDSLN
jgi:SUKH superfamily protein